MRSLHRPRRILKSSDGRPVPRNGQKAPSPITESVETRSKTDAGKD